MAKQQSVDRAFESFTTTVPENVESALIASPLVSTPLEVNHVIVHVSTIVTSNSTATTFNFALRRGPGVNGVSVFSSGIVGVSVPIGDSVPFAFDFAEDLVGTDFAQYTFTLTTSGAAVNTPTNQNFIRVECF